MEYYFGGISSAILTVVLAGVLWAARNTDLLCPVLKTGYYQSLQLDVRGRAPITQVAHLGYPYLETEMSRHLTASLTSGQSAVHVLWAPIGAGKTSAVRRVLQKLRDDNRINQVHYLSAGALIPSDSPQQWFPKKMSLLGEFPLNKLLRSEWPLLESALGYLPWIWINRTWPSTEQQAVIVIDQFDELYNAHLQDQVKNLITALALQATDQCLFHVVLVVNNPVIYQSVLSWNGSSKIRRVIGKTDLAACKWDKSRIEQVIAGFTLSESYKKTLIEEAVLAGTPEFVLVNANIEIPAAELHELALVKSREWELVLNKPIV